MNPFDFADYDALKELHPHCPLTRAGYEAALEEQRERRIEELIEQYLEDDLVIYDAINDNETVRKAISEICQILPKLENAREDRKPDYVDKLIEQCKRIEFSVVKYVTEVAENDA